MKKTPKKESKPIYFRYSADAVNGPMYAYEKMKLGEIVYDDCDNYDSFLYYVMLFEKQKSGQYMGFMTQGGDRGSPFCNDFGHIEHNYYSLDPQYLYGRIMKNNQVLAPGLFQDWQRMPELSNREFVAVAGLLTADYPGDGCFILQPECGDSAEQKGFVWTTIALNKQKQQYEMCPKGWMGYCALDTKVVAAHHRSRIKDLAKLGESEALRAAKLSEHGWAIEDAIAQFHRDVLCDNRDDMRTKMLDGWRAKQK